MNKKVPRKESGSKLSRSETVTVRLDPKLRYLAELASRKQRRTLSSFIEWAIEDSLSRVELYQGSSYEDPSINLKDESEKLWDVDAADRLCKLASTYPELLTHDEQRIWKLIKELNNAVIDEKPESTWGLFIDEKPICPAIKILWDFLWQQINDELDYQELIKIMKEKIPPITYWEKRQPPQPGLSYEDFDGIPF